MKSLCNINVTSRSNQAALTSQSEHPSEILPGITEYYFEYDSSPTKRTILERPNQPSLPDKPFVILRIINSVLGIAGVWRPDAGFQKNLVGDWGNCFLTNISHSAPVLCFFDYEGGNRLTLAIDEVNRDVYFSSGVHEETGEIFTDITIYLSEVPMPYRLRLRVDQRSLPFEAVIKDVSAWWDGLLSEVPLTAPAEAVTPMYSTWYSYHQAMTDQALIAECKTAAKLGMRTIIIDDGWQTSDNSRGYGYCGDWKAEPSKFPDFGGFVEKVHALGMKCILWYSVPFIGRYSRVWSRFEHHFLHYDSVLHTGILDPRYPMVRRYLISTYKEAADTWHLDGFKLDFIDSFRAYPDTPPYNPEMDFVEIQDAVYRLMLDIRYTLGESNPNLLLEFRQNYIGPQMRRFGNFFRVGDCPLSGISNRVGITDLKLLGGSSAVHSDMILWNANEAAQDVAIQLINCIFATLQISVRLNHLTKEQQSVLRHYLDFSLKYRDVLLKGNFSVKSPLGFYPLLISSTDKLRIAAIYDADRCVDFSDGHISQELWILNGTHASNLYIRIPEGSHYAIMCYDCTGTLMSDTRLDAGAQQIHILSAAPGGSLNLKPLT